MSQSLATKAFHLAFKHTNKICFKPFKLNKWLKLGFINLLIGGGASGGGSGGGSNFNLGNSGKTSQPPEIVQKIIIWCKDNQSIVIAGISILVLLFIGIILLFTWLASVFNFIFLDNVIQNKALIKEPFHRLKPKGWSYFWWNIGFGLIVLFTLGVAVGLPILLLIWSKPPGVIIAFGVIYLITAFLAIITTSAVIGILTRDFILPVMYLENLKILAAWKKYIPTLKTHIGQTVIYLLLKIVVGIAAVIAAGFVSIIMLIVCGIPLGILVLLGVLIAMAIGATWNIVTIALVAIAGIVVILGFVYIFSCLMMPVEVFRRTFALLFLGECQNEWVSLPDLP